jgi:hypothetical protein
MPHGPGSRLDDYEIVSAPGVTGDIWILDNGDK